MSQVQSRATMLFGVLVLITALMPNAYADGTETLGPFGDLADGNRIVGNGIGLCELPECNGAGTDRLIEFTVPAGATVEQVLLYWNGFHTLEDNGDDTLEADGIEVTGDLIGGPFFFFFDDGVPNWSTSYRADITDLGLVVEGVNSIQITGGDFDNVTNGASILAVLDDGSATEIQLVDGQDLAYCSDGSPEDGCPAFPPPRDTTVTQTFTFANVSDYEREAELIIFAGSVEGPASAGPPERPNVARIITGGVVTDVPDPLASNNEDEWDHVTLMVTIPAGATDLTIQMLSSHSFEGDERQPASFNWVGSALSLPEPFCGDEQLDLGETCDPPGSIAGVNGNECREDCTVCGDGNLDDGEQCDDGNSDDLDGCRNNCTVPTCGDMVIDPGETCDPPGMPGGNNGNDCRGDCTVCGDGLVDVGEDCDDGNGVDTDECRNDCTVPVCGDEILDEGETCDPPGTPAGASGNECRGDCTVCGDGNVDVGEECDDGNNTDTDDCRNDCTMPICGDEIVDEGETCDPPGTPAGGNGNDCRGDCTVCGDGNVDDGEQCDDGNGIDDDECRNDCTMPMCGDQVVDEGETCDPPDSPAGGNGNTCRDDCTSCGDGNVDDGEDCDDGNGVDTDECRNDCTVPVCGDEIVDTELGETCDPPGTPAGGNGNDCRGDCTSCGDGNVDDGEDCDDGNGVDTDECRNDCTMPICGDDIVDEGETCDPPGSPAGGNGNDCRGDCTSCGDGNVDDGEDCDDGNGVDTDECRNDCTVPVCGDEILDDGETCDPPGTPAGGNGNDCRGDCTSCGDGNVDDGEDCDDGNGVDTDECRNDCTMPICGDEIVDEGETCDPPGSPAGGNGNDCRGDCTSCGDGNVDDGEDCDDGNGVDTDECRNDCTMPICGDDIVDEGETCDPPGSPAGGNGNDCRGDCTSCGDGNVDDGEDCDDGNGVDTDECRNDCTVPVCGDEILDDGETCDPPGTPAGGNGNDCRGDCTSCGDGNVDDGEDCDDGNGVDTDECRNDCTVPVCGDEILDDGETCDPPGTPAGGNGNDCRGDCTSCGDGNVDDGEDCDDGNGVDTDECRNDCTVPVCGDEILDDGETCDPPGSPAGGNGNDCRGDCTSCGDGNVDDGEDCDDGNGVDTDECRNDCTVPVCGDEILDDGETCDPPGSPAGGNGNDCRGDCTSCGDGNVDDGEDCDDGNGVDTDECRNDCTVPVCGDEILDDGETCDPPGSPAGGNGNDCRGDCTSCGDGNVDDGEDCDDGNGVDTDECRNDCTVPVCGDEILDDGETCDPPGSPAGGNGNDCRGDCTSCGDGNVDDGEDCDDGNGVDTDECRNDCTVPVCGDEIVDEGETCDPPGSPAGASGNECRGDCTVCGDGNVDDGEDCDDGNNTDTDECRNDCTMPTCGDEIVDEGETCDPPGSPAGGNGNDCRGDCTSCGDGNVDDGEDCDDGNGVDTDECRNDCTVPVCGDEIVDEGETCDPPGSPAGGNGNDCRDDCTSCGDGSVDDGEECDDGNGVDTDECRNDCTVPVCGDGQIDRDETCDPPGKPVDQPSECRDDCTYCGDGVLDDSEECDDGNNDPGDGCDAFCVIEPECGDGNVDEDLGETCDPPGTPGGNNGNDCREDCTSCGDGVMDDGEECDDGNGVDSDACRNNCTVPVCGDNVVDMQNGETCDPPGSPAGASGNPCRGDCTVCGDGNPDAGEECDDGNNTPGDGCENDCTVTPFCGDGEIGPDETCDPPGTPAGGNGNDCREDCTSCGDGNVDGGEECDDGNGVDTDDCRNDCTVPTCGDEIVDEGETCDPPGTPAGGNGNDCRDDCTSCGDGTVDDGEECDDANGVDTDDCRNDCTVPTCGDEILDEGETCDPPGSPAGQPDECREDCTFCGDDNVDRGEECDDGNNEDGDGCDANCLVETNCELEVSKTCFVPEGQGDDDDDDDDDCRGKVLGMKLEYTGDGCDVLTNPQGGKAGCYGGSDGAEPVSIRVNDDRGDLIYGEDAVVLLGDIIEATAANAGEDKFGSQTDVVIDYGLEEVTFHTSCSQPLQVGDQFGSVRLVELTTTEGGVITLPDEDPDPAEGQKECVISPTPAGEHCDGKIKVLTMKYLGGSCDDSIENQEDKFSCSGDAGATQPVRVVCGDYLDTGEPASVNLGDLVDISAANAGDTTLGSQTDCSIYDEYGNWVQDVSFHTSCSKPVDLGNRFGSLEVFSLDTTGGGFIAIGQNVIYTYKITNNSDSPAVNVSVIDDKLGPVPGSPIPFIPAHGMVVLQTNALISEDTTNIVSVDGELENGVECPEVSDFAIVRVEDPPEGIEECTSKVKATLLTYIGPDVAGHVTVEAVGRSGGNPVVYELPGGLTSGTTLSSPAENGFTIDGTTRGETDLGSKMTITINGIDEVHHTSCSVPYVSGLPAPLDQPKGDPSPLWFVESFTQKN